MFGWSINLFRIRGIQLAVHASFFLLLAYVGYEGWEDGGWVPLLWSIGLLLAFFTCVVLHELGHSLTARGFGVRVRRILLMPIGGMAEFDEIPREPVRELLITVAGPAVNFALTAIIWIIVGLPNGWALFGFANFPENPAGFLQLVAHWNLLMGLFNLLPVFPMDGGRIFRAILASQMPYLQATFWAATVAKVLAVALGLVFGLVFHNYPAACLFVFILIVGDAEYRAVQRSDLEDVPLHGLVRRLTPGAPPVEEPPLLGP